MSRQSRVDRQMQKLEREFRRQNLVLRKNKAASTKAKALARFASSLPAPALAEMLMTFIIMISSAVHKKNLKQLLENEIGEDFYKVAEPLIEELEIPEGMSLNDLLIEFDEVIYE